MARASGPDRQGQGRKTKSPARARQAALIPEALAQKIASQARAQAPYSRKTQAPPQARQVSAVQLRDQFTEIFEQVATGQEFTVTKRGIPIAVISPIWKAKPGVHILPGQVVFNGVPVPKPLPTGKAEPVVVTKITVESEPKDWSKPVGSWNQRNSEQAARDALLRGIRTGKQP